MHERLPESPELMPSSETTVAVRTASGTVTVTKTDLLKILPQDAAAIVFATLQGQAMGLDLQEWDRLTIDTRSVFTQLSTKERFAVLSDLAALARKYNLTA